MIDRVNRDKYAQLIEQIEQQDTIKEIEHLQEVSQQCYACIDIGKDFYNSLICNDKADYCVLSKLRDELRDLKICSTAMDIGKYAFGVANRKEQRLRVTMIMRNIDYVERTILRMKQQKEYEKKVIILRGLLLD